MRHFEVLGIPPTHDEAAIREAIMRESLDWSERVLLAKSPSERRAAESHLRAIDDARRALLTPAGQRPGAEAPTGHPLPRPIGGGREAPPPVHRVRFYRDEQEAYAQQFQPGYEAPSVPPRYADDFDDDAELARPAAPRQEEVGGTTKWVAGLAGLGLFMAGLLWAGGVFDSPVNLPPPLPTAVDPQLVQGGLITGPASDYVVVPPNESFQEPAEPAAPPAAPVAQTPEPVQPPVRPRPTPRAAAVERPPVAPARPKQATARRPVVRTERWVSQAGAFTLDYPSDRLKPVGAVPAGGGQRFVSEDGQVVMDVVARYNGDGLNVARALALASAPMVGRRVTHQSNGASWYVQSGNEGGKLFYEKTLLRNRQIKSLRIVMPAGHRDQYYGTVEAISQSFKSLD